MKNPPASLRKKEEGGGVESRNLIRYQIVVRTCDGHPRLMSCKLGVTERSESISLESDMESSSSAMKVEPGS